MYTALYLQMSFLSTFTRLSRGKPVLIAGRRAALLLALVFAAVQSSFAANWHVSQTGEGLRNGASQANSWPVSIFNASATWSAAAGSSTKISPGDTVNVYGTITSTMNCGGSGLAGNGITVSFDSAARLVSPAQWKFNGKDYITLLGCRVNDNAGPASGGMFLFGVNSGNISIGCTIDGLISVNKNGSSLVSFDYSNHCTLQNSRITGFIGNGIEGDAFVSFATIKNNHIETTDGAAAFTTDLIKLGWATDVLIEGNKLILKADKSTGDPHNDILQCWHNYQDTSQRPRNWKIINNWIEASDVRFLSGATGSTAFTNFAMLQYMEGEFLFRGNVFYGHDLSSGAGNGVNLSRHQAFASNGQLTVKFHNNTFVSVRRGLVNLITISSQSSAAASNKLEIINNIFFGDFPTGQPIRESISTMQGGVFTMRNNLFYGWAGAVGALDAVTGELVRTTSFNTSWGEGGRRLQAAEIPNLFRSGSAEDFSLGEDSLARGNGIPSSTENFGLTTSLRADAFPNPATVTSVNAAVIGAHLGTSAATPPATPTGLRVVTPPPAPSP